MQTVRLTDKKTLKIHLKILFCNMETANMFQSLGSFSTATHHFALFLSIRWTVSVFCIDPVQHSSFFSSLIATNVDVFISYQAHRRANIKLIQLQPLWQLGMTPLQLLVQLPRTTQQLVSLLYVIAYSIWFCEY